MTSSQRSGPASHRLLVWVFSLAFALLCYWLLGFILNDIGSQAGPDYEALESQMLPALLVDNAENLTEQIAETERDITDLSQQQRILGESISNSQRTVNQLLEIQRLSIENDTELSATETAAMTDNLELFLEDQRQYQLLNQQIADLNRTLQSLREQQRINDDALAEAREPVQEEYRQRLQRHNLKLAAMKLGVLIPLLVIVLLLFLRYRDSLYAPMIYAAGAAVAIRVLLVMHEHFPAEYFKYILISLSLLVVGWILVHLLRMIAFPKRDWLMKQYREAYASFFCPVCEFPIQRGPLRYRAWTRRSIRKPRFHHHGGETAESDDPYWCPACHTQLFEKCDRCGGTRHSLLGGCDKCGQDKAPAAPGPS